MEDERENPKQGEQQEKSAADLYLDELNKLKANTVKKEDFDKIKAERDKLIQAAAERTFSPSGEDDEAAKAAKDEAKAKARRERISELSKFFQKRDENVTNLQYAKNALELRDLVLEETDNKDDIFVNPNASPTNESYEHAERTADVLKQCVEIADGDPALFTTALQSRLKDDPKNQIQRRA